MDLPEDIRAQIEYRIRRILRYDSIRRSVGDQPKLTERIEAVREFEQILKDRGLLPRHGHFVTMIVDLRVPYVQVRIPVLGWEIEVTE